MNDLVLITGGAGFIGTNLAARLLAAGRKVLIFDNLSRPGSEVNLQWLRASFGDNLKVAVEDIRNGDAVDAAVSAASEIFHFAAQVAVTSSLKNPRVDFDINVGGTLNVLEAMRNSRRSIPLVYTSTNKVYGALDDVELEANDTRYQPMDRILRETGISESRPLSFHSPYGCSKGAADQYILDYARSFGLRAVVLRMSCIYGQRQFGNEDQGWVAHFLIQALARSTITVYGDGKQVRDILFVDDLVNALLLCRECMSDLSGRAFNLGGGRSNTVSLIEVLNWIRRLAAYEPAIERASPRIGDQRYFVSDTHRFSLATGWRANVAASDGIVRLFDWLRARDQDVEPVTAKAHMA